MNRTSNAHPMSDLGCQLQRENWRAPEEPRQRLVRTRFWIGLAIAVAWWVWL